MPPKKSAKKTGAGKEFMKVSGMSKEGADLLESLGFTALSEFGEKPVMELLWNKLDQINDPSDVQIALNSIKLCKLQAVKEDEEKMDAWAELLEMRGITTKVAWTLVLAGLTAEDVKEMDLTEIYKWVMTNSDVTFRQLQDLYLSLVTNKLNTKAASDEVPGPYSRVPGP